MCHVLHYRLQSWGALRKHGGIDERCESSILHHLHLHLHLKLQLLLMLLLLLLLVVVLLLLPVVGGLHGLGRLQPSNRIEGGAITILA